MQSDSVQIELHSTLILSINKHRSTLPSRTTFINHNLSAVLRPTHARVSLTLSPSPLLSTYPLLSAFQAERYGQAYWEHAAPLLLLFKSTFIFCEGLGIKQKLFTQMWMAYLFASVLVTFIGTMKRF